MLSQIKQSFKGYSAGPLRGELSDGEEAGSAVRLGPTSSPHSRLAAVKLWADYLTSMCFGFLFCKIGIIESTSEDFCEN